MKSEVTMGSTEYLIKALKNVDTAMYSGLKTNLAEPLITIKDTKISSRVFNSWKNAELFPAKEDGKWVKLNFIEYIWLKIIDELRKFGLPLEIIKVIKNDLFYPIDLFSNVINDKDLANKAISQIEASSIDPDIKKQVLELLRNPEKVHQNNMQIVKLEGMILNTLIFKQDVGLIIYSSGDFIPWYDQFYNYDKNIDVVFRQPHIYLSLTNFIFQFVSDESKEKFIAPYTLLSASEIQILKLVRMKEVIEIIIKFPLNNGKKEISISTKKEKYLTPTQEMQIREIIGLNNYGTIEAKTRSGGKLYVTSKKYSTLK